MKRYLPQMFLVLIAALIAGPASADDNETKLYNQGKKALSNKNYEEAARLFSELTEQVQDNAEYDFLAGLSYLYSSTDRLQSIDYFNTAISKFQKDTIAETYFYLGEAYALKGEFTKAAESWEQFRVFIQKDKKSGDDLLKQLDHLIANAEYAETNKHSVNIEHKVTNLASINTEFPEYAPVLTPDRQAMIFTSRRSSTTGGKKAADNEYFEDIQVAQISDGTWAVTEDKAVITKYIYEDFNSNKMDAGVYYGPEGDKMFIYRKDKIYESNLNESGVWQDPEAIENIHKGRKHTPSVTLSKDGNTMIFATKSNDGFGGRDLYLTTKKSDGTWNTPTNLGPDINTSSDEDSPMLSEDGKTLWFASNGLLGFGGYDLFTTQMSTENTFSLPVNAGQPINSPADDIYLVMNDGEKTGFFSSGRLGGKGHMDIYEISFVRPAVDVNITGVAWYDDRNIPADDVKITFIDQETGDEIQTIRPERATGRYDIVLPSDKTYIVKVTQQGKEEFSNTLTIPKVTDNYESFQQISMNSLLNDVGQETERTIQIRSGFFDVTEEAGELADVNVDAPFLNDHAKEQRFMALFNSNPNDSRYVTINDTLKMNYITAVDEYRKYFGYNESKMTGKEAKFLSFVTAVAEQLKTNPTLTLVIDASASKVPTETYPSNEDLAFARLKEAKQMILDELTKLKVDASGIQWESSSAVTGPPYDASTTDAVTLYKRYQFVDLRIKE